MENWEVIAVDKNSILRFKNDGKEIRGVRFLLRGNEPVGGDKDRYLGFNWFDQFISHERLEKLNVFPLPGDIVNISFNRYGDIISIDIL